jgi:peptidoglycan hydrolase-like protein with peptidoglycan-binding domain
VKPNLRTEICAYAGALPVAATLLALGIPGITPAASAQASRLPTSGAPVDHSAIASPRTPAARSAHTLVLHPGTGYEPGGSRLVRDLQRLLAGSGYRPGPIDGRYGPSTERAVSRFQRDRGLQVDGIAGPQTLTALSAAVALYPGAGYEPGGSRFVRRLQRHLARAGYPPGPIDGRYGPLTEQAVRRYQANRGLQVDGIAGPQTLGAPSVTGRSRRAKPARALRLRRSHHPAARHLAPAQAPTNAKRASHPLGSISLDLLVLVALGLLLMLAATYAGRRRRERVIPSMPTRSNGKQPAAVARNGDRGEATEGKPSRPSRAGIPHRPGERVESNGVAGGANGAYYDIEGAFNLGVLREDRGDLAGAETAYRRADRHGHGAAATNLGVLLEGRGDLAGAEKAYRRADQRGQASGAFNLGALLEERGDLAAAEEAYRRADVRDQGKVGQKAHGALLDLGAFRGVGHDGNGRG